MPKLYYTATSCGAANFIAAKASGLTWEAEQVDLATHRTLVGDVDFYTINPKGNVPCIVLDDGSVLNENVATLSYIGMQGENNPLYPNDPAARAKINNALSYTSSEYHATIGNLFNPTLSEELKAHFLAAGHRKLTYINDVLLKDNKFLTGEEVSVADFYFYITLTWSGYLQIDTSKYAAVEAYIKTMSEHPAVTSGLEAIATTPNNIN
ncbi:unnamed protein product [Ectocarpus fasciculatus]